jgi:hypothetical protein
MCNFCSGIFFRIESNNNVAAAWKISLAVVVSNEHLELGM